MSRAAKYEALTAWLNEYVAAADARRAARGLPARMKREDPAMPGEAGAGADADDDSGDGDTI